MTIDHHNPEQARATNEASVDELIGFWRASLARKRERHGTSFTETRALGHLIAQLTDLPRPALVVLLAMTTNRLAQMPDYNPVPTELADLDFDIQQGVQE